MKVRAAFCIQTSSGQRCFFLSTGYLGSGVLPSGSGTGASSQYAPQKPARGSRKRPQKRSESGRFMAASESEVKKRAVVAAQHLTERGGEDHQQQRPAQSARPGTSLFDQAARRTVPAGNETQSA